MDIPRKRNMHPFPIIVIAILLSIAGLVGFYLGRNTNPAASASLPLQVTVDYSLDFTTFPLEQQNYSKLTYLGIREVTVDINGTTRKLEDAVREGSITLDQLVASARLDAVNRLCYETAESKNGLTRFTYRYPDYHLLYTYDLYETPDGKRHLVKDLDILAPTKDVPFLSFEAMDYEDWGLTFEADEISASGLTLQCTQSGGQQVGALVIEDYFLETSTLESVAPLTETLEPRPSIPIPSDRTTQIPFDFVQEYGSLPAGDYVLTLEVHDRYNKDALHPLMRKYHNFQFYPISFTIE